ncbi:unnamed protein product [Vicia faba]|uniref:Uncharacterized protein n=1 Tax=Vicia faba TaxID=3906 RepID=A0AAV0YV82_VICFA|nr:unnamed protein product [Vicia faba]
MELPSQSLQPNSNQRCHMISNSWINKKLINQYASQIHQNPSPNNCGYNAKRNKITVISKISSSSIYHTTQCQILFCSKKRKEDKQNQTGGRSKVEARSESILHSETTSRDRRASKLHRAQPQGSLTPSTRLLALTPSFLAVRFDPFPSRSCEFANLYPIL